MSDILIKEEMIKEINSAGFELEDFNHLPSLKPKHKFLIPILLRYLGKFERLNTNEMIVRALGVKGFYDATSRLIDEYHKSDNRFYKWAIGNSLSIILDQKYEDEYIEIIKNKANASSRQMVVITLGKLKSIKAIEFFIQLLDDDDIDGHIIMALKYYKNKELIKYIEPFLNHNKSWIRQEAKKSIKKLSE
jgi:HEAT repeat protein